MNDFERSVFMLLLGVTIILMGILIELNRLRKYAYSLTMSKDVPEYKQNPSDADHIKYGGFLSSEAMVAGARVRVGQDHTEYRQRHENEDDNR
jgi:hypothetical protein